MAMAGGVGVIAWCAASWVTPLANERFWCALPIGWLTWHVLDADKPRLRQRTFTAVVAVAAAVGLAWYMAAAVAYSLRRQVIGGEVAIAAYFLLAVAVLCQIVLAAADRLARWLWGVLGRIPRAVRRRSLGATKPQQETPCPTGGASASDERGGTRLPRTGLRWCKSLLGLILILPILIEAIQLHPLRTAPSAAARRVLQEMAVPLEVVTGDGLELSAMFIPARGGPAGATAIICHGVADSKEGMISLIRFVTARDYNAVVFDMRGHGSSGGHTTTFGVLEGGDVLAVYQEAKRKWPEAFETVVGCGWSMGAAALVYAQAEGGLFDALWLDCPYAWTAEMAWQIAAKFPPGVRRLVWLGGTALGSLEVGVNFFQSGPAQRMPELPPVPTVIVHGTADEVIPFEQGVKLFELTRPPKRFLRAEGAVHCGSWDVLRSRYDKALARLLREAREHTPRPKKADRLRHDQAATARQG